MGSDVAPLTLPEGYNYDIADMVFKGGRLSSRRGDGIEIAQGANPAEFWIRAIYGLKTADLAASVIYTAGDKFFLWDGVSVSDITPTSGPGFHFEWYIDFVSSGVIISSPTQIPYLWATSTSPPYNPAVPYTQDSSWGWPGNRYARVIRSFQNFAIALLEQDEQGGTVPTPYRVRWSQPVGLAQIPIWEDNPAVLPGTVAGYSDRESHLGALVDCREYQAANLLFFEQGIVKMTYIGAANPAAVFRFDQFVTDDGCKQTGATVVTERGIVAAGQNSIYVTNGAVKQDLDFDQQLGSTTIRNSFYRQLVDNRSVKLHYNRRWREVYVFFGTDVTSTDPFRANKAFIYNVDRNAWSRLDLDSLLMANRFVTGIGRGFQFTGAAPQEIRQAGGDYTLTAIGDLVGPPYRSDIVRLGYDETESSDVNGDPFSCRFITGWFDLSKAFERPIKDMCVIREIVPIMIGDGQLQISYETKRHVWSEPINPEYSEVFDMMSDSYLSVDLPAFRYIRFTVQALDTKPFQPIGFDIDVIVEGDA